MDISSKSQSPRRDRIMRGDVRTTRNPKEERRQTDFFTSGWSDQDLYYRAWKYYILYDELTLVDLKPSLVLN